VGVVVGVGRGRGRGLGRGLGDGVGSGGGAAPVTAGTVGALGDGEALVVGSAVGVLDGDASERSTAQATSPHIGAACAARGRAATGGLCITRNAPDPPTTISPAAHGATTRARHVGREPGRPPAGGSDAGDGSLAPLNGPVGMRPPS
jgi:hypothetical protein